MRRVLLLALGAAAVAGFAGCGQEATRESDNLVNGKQLFVSKCGACHTLSRAGTKGTVGPNLDQAFHQGLSEGMDRGGVRGAVREQILHPARVSRTSPVYMPANLVKGHEADAVAAYVAASVAKPGQDTGLLATA